VRDIKRSRAFYADCLRTPGQRRNRGRALFCAASRSATTTHWCCAGAITSTYARSGFKLASEDDLDRAEAWFRRPQTCRRRFRTCRIRACTLRTADVFGTPLDLYATMERRPSMLQKYANASGRAHPAY